MSIKNRLLLIFSYSSLYQYIFTFREFYLDFKAYIKYSGLQKKDRIKHDSKTFAVIKELHALEKGLSLPCPRADFGRTKVEFILDFLINELSFNKSFSSSRLYKVAYQVLNQWFEYRADRGVLSPEEIEVKWTALSKDKEVSYQRIGGTLISEQKSKVNSQAPPFIDLALSRHSVRCFDSKSVDIKLIRNAIKVALRTPSVCNRHPWICHIYFNENKRQELLNIQNGNQGFGIDAPCLLVISIDQRAFFGWSERRQSLHEGGLFGMSLIYALEALGVSSCCLNLSLSNKKLETLKSAGEISEYELPTMMLAIGYEALNSAYPISDRVNEENIMRNHE